MTAQSPAEWLAETMADDRGPSCDKCGTSNITTNVEIEHACGDPRCTIPTPSHLRRVTVRTCGGCGGTQVTRERWDDVGQDGYEHRTEQS